MNTEKRLNTLSVGECGRVVGFVTEGSMRRRFLDIGILPGTLIECVGKSPLGDPRAYLIRGTLIDIRSRYAYGIIIK